MFDNSACLTIKLSSDSSSTNESVFPSIDRVVTLKLSNVRSLGISGTTLTSTLASRFPTTVAFVNAASSAANVFIATLCAASSTVASESVIDAVTAAILLAAITFASMFPVTLRLSNVRSLTFAKSNLASRSPVTIAFVALSDDTVNESNVKSLGISGTTVTSTFAFSC